MIIDIPEIVSLIHFSTDLKNAKGRVVSRARFRT
jgi:hypothetical protein